MGLCNSFMEESGFFGEAGWRGNELFRAAVWSPVPLTFALDRAGGGIPWSLAPKTKGKEGL